MHATTSTKATTDTEATKANNATEGITNQGDRTPSPAEMHPEAQNTFKLHQDRTDTKDC